VFCIQKTTKDSDSRGCDANSSLYAKREVSIQSADNANIIKEKVSPSLLSQTIYMSISVSVLLQLNLFISKSSTEGSPGCNCGGPSRPIE
jgi:hypothetical protein